jgi:mevalonate kinase
MPFVNFSGHWILDNKKTPLVDFFQYLISLSGYNEERLLQAIGENWRFESSIPYGYGSGSSGALTAAAFDAFYDQKPDDLLEMQSLLAKAESFFHGKSSGLDPLTSYFNCAILLSDGHPQKIDNLRVPKGFFLYDSGMKRNTKSLVDTFLYKRNSDNAFRTALLHLEKLNNQLIDAMLKGKQLNDMMAQLSRLQFDYFKEMIPDHVATVWAAGLKSNAYSMKLSGAGGGGYFLLCANGKLDLDNLIAL